MKIKSIRIQSYKSFADSGWIDLSEHFTVLVGQNNAGKSAFLQAFDVHSFVGSPHKSPSRGPAQSPSSSLIGFRVQVPGEELKQRAFNSSEFKVVTNHAIGRSVLDLLFGQANVFEMSMAHANSVTTPSSPTHGLFNGNNLVSLSVTVDQEKREILNATTSENQGISDGIPGFLNVMIRESTFFFNAQRYAIGRCGMVGGSKLSANADNLPYMLFSLNKDHGKFELFQSLVSEILPSIKRVVISPVAQEIEISIQQNESLRGDLAIPLNDCGTGVSQILAMIYVIVAYPAAQLIIDEPNSFLHPSATRRLLNILRRFDQHQYILSTHSSDVIAVVEPERLLLLRWDETKGETEVVANSGTDVEHVKASLTELGAGLSDVFGYDLVVFVEGPTEAKCFPLLITNAAMTAMNFVSMREASALTSAKPEAMFDIYRKGVIESALMPPKVRFSFDPDGRDATKQADIVRASKGTAQFLKVPMYENYLLHPKALSARLQVLDGVRPETAPDAIDRYLQENFTSFPVKGLDNKSLRTCDAAKLLAKMFPELTETRYEYGKVDEGEKLTKWLLENEPASLQELKDHISNLLK
jgi:uncharacterized protein with GYD domain